MLYLAGLPFKHRGTKGKTPQAAAEWPTLKTTLEGKKKKNKTSNMKIKLRKALKSMENKIGRAHV